MDIMDLDFSSTEWTQAEAIALCVIAEGIAPRFGGHVALTGGCLYKRGERKDCDLLFYCIRQVDEIDIGGLLNALSAAGMVIGQRYGWVQKATWQGKNVDMFFPEAYPASSASRVNDAPYGGRV